MLQYNMLYVIWPPDGIYTEVVDACTAESVVILVSINGKNEMMTIPRDWTNNDS